MGVVAGRECAPVFMPKVGLEPTRGFPHRILSRIRGVSARAARCRFAPNHAADASHYGTPVSRGVARCQTVHDHPVTRSVRGTVRSRAPTYPNVTRANPARLGAQGVAAGLVQRTVRRPKAVLTGQGHALARRELGLEFDPDGIHQAERRLRRWVRSLAGGHQARDRQDQTLYRLFLLWQREYQRVAIVDGRSKSNATKLSQEEYDEILALSGTVEYDPPPFATADAFARSLLE